MENVQVQVGAGIPYADRSLPEIDVNHPVYPIRGSYLRYQITRLAAYTGPPGKNASCYNNPKATGYCYKTTFGDWRCDMSDPNATNDENARHHVAPPRPK